jgi:hypothetical protein
MVIMIGFLLVGSFMHLLSNVYSSYKVARRVVELVTFAHSLCFHHSMLFSCSLHKKNGTVVLFSHMRRNSV